MDAQKWLDAVHRVSALPCRRAVPHLAHSSIIQRRNSPSMSSTNSKHHHEQSAYDELSWLPATSVQVERLFSSLMCMLGYLRKSMSANTLETIVYLRMNWDLVSDEVVSKAVKEAKEEDEECDTYW